MTKLTKCSAHTEPLPPGKKRSLATNPALMLRPLTPAAYAWVVVCSSRPAHVSAMRERSLVPTCVHKPSISRMAVDFLGIQVPACTWEQAKEGSHPALGGVSGDSHRGPSPRATSQQLRPPGGFVTVVQLFIRAS